MFDGALDVDFDSLDLGSKRREPVEWVATAPETSGRVKHQHQRRYASRILAEAFRRHPDVRCNAVQVWKLSFASLLSKARAQTVHRLSVTGSQSVYPGNGPRPCDFSTSEGPEMFAGHTIITSSRAGEFF